MTRGDVAPVPEWITVKELAQVLRVDRKTAYRLVAEGLVGVRRLGRVIRIHRPSLMHWLTHHDAPPEVNSAGQERGSLDRRSR